MTECHPLCHRSTPGLLLPPLHPPAPIQLSPPVGVTPRLFPQSYCLCRTNWPVDVCCNTEATFPCSSACSDMTELSPQLFDHRLVFFFSTLSSLWHLWAPWKWDLPSLSGLWLCLIIGWVIDVSMTQTPDLDANITYGVFLLPYNTHCVWTEYTSMQERVRLLWDVFCSKVAVPELFGFEYLRMEQWIDQLLSSDCFNWLFFFF